MFNMLSVPREGVELGDVFSSDESGQKLSPATNIKNFLTPAFQMPTINPPKRMLDISGEVSQNIDASIGLDFLQNFINLLSSLDVGASIKANYDASNVRKIKYQFIGANRQYVDSFLFGDALVEHKVKTDNPAFNPRKKYFVVLGVIQTNSINVEAEDGNSNKVDVDVGVAGLADVKPKLEINKSGKGVITYTGDKELALGVELCELIYSSESNKFKLVEVDRPYKTKEGETEVTHIRKEHERSFIGDRVEGDLFVEVD